MDLRHAIWLGGVTGSGKSSIAKALAQGHDLQLYNVDHRTWTHSARAGEEAFLSLSVDERWLHPSPEQLVDRFVRAAVQRLPHILEDLAQLPEAPGAIVEGPQLLPSLIAPYVAAPDQALVLLPTEQRQQATVAARGSMPGASDPKRVTANLHRRNVQLAERLAREAEQHGFVVLAVDRGLDAMIERAEGTLAPALARIPRGGNLAAVRRLENDALATQVRLLPLEAYDALGPADRREPLRGLAGDSASYGGSWKLHARSRMRAHAIASSL